MLDFKYMREKFVQSYNKKPEHIFYSPGRINLIGEHIDYNGGLVMPCAISQGTCLLVSANKDGVFRLRSVNFDEHLEIPINTDFTKSGELWYNHPLGIIKYFADRGIDLKGLDLLFGGDIPIASGLSSSASIGIVTAFAVNSLFQTKMHKLELVRLAKSSENNFIGVNCGIMDQYAVTFGEKGKAMLLDCNKPGHVLVNCDFGDYLLVIANTNKPRSLAESKYNERVEECHSALNALNQQLDINNLCILDPEQFALYSHLIKDQTILKRATHVVEENYRVQIAANALAANDLEKIGQLLYKSHESLRYLYEVSGKELDAIVTYCKSDPAVLGARMTGAGFGGCAIALVKKSGYESFVKGLTEFYSAEIGYAPSVYQSTISGGVFELESCDAY